jgi:formate hydrogenlyase transcriptional activator
VVHTDPCQAGSPPDERQRRERDRSRLLLEINNAIVSHLSLQELLKAISDCLRRAIPHDAAGLALYDSDHHELRLHALDFPRNQGFVEGVPIPLEGTPEGLALTSQRTVLLRNLDLTQFPAQIMKQGEAEGLKSGCAVPLISHGRALGTLRVISLREAAFTEEDADLLNQIGMQVAIAVENALNFEGARSAEQQMKRERDRSRLLLDVNNAVASHLDLDKLLKAISACLRSVVAHDFAGLALYDSGCHQFRIHALDFAKNQDFIGPGGVFPVDGTPSGLAFVSRETVTIQRLDLSQFSAEIMRHVSAQGIKSGVCVPLISHGRVLGTMDVGSFREAAFAKEDAELLTQIGSQVAIAVANALAMRELELLRNKLAEEKLYLEEEIQTDHNFEQVIGGSATLRRVLDQVKTVAATDSTVLIRGETGTGKELIARAIHNLSARHERTLVKINCAAIPTGLLESELFGHEKGAFTGAIAQRIGRFELAHRGTLFLDEVGDIPLDLQPKLLRVLQEQEFERLGSSRTQRVDVRLVAATNCALESMVAGKQFRSDLYYRLNVFPITIPPLRERPEDIPLLVRFFAQKFARRMRKQIETIPAEASEALVRYSWPGNVRELENLVERAVILSQGAALQIPLGELKSAADARFSASSPSKATESAGDKLPDNDRLEAVERDHILHVLQEARWVVGGSSGAAARLGMKRTTLQARMRKLGISRQS